jgi:uncharacterized protein (TIGR00730 family)
MMTAVWHIYTCGGLSMLVSVFGASQLSEADTRYQDAVQVGNALALAGHTVMTGGYAGMMQAVSQGANQGGGHVIGVTCDQIEAIRPGICPNPYVIEQVHYSKMEERLMHLIRQADAYVVMWGGVGTLNELVMAWELMRVNEMAVKPIVCHGATWQTTMQGFMREHGIPQAHQAMLQFALTPQSVVDALQ